MEFYERNEMGGQTDNWVGPNLACLMAMSRVAGFARVHFLARLAHSACLACYKTWGNPTNASTTEPRPKLLTAFHNTNFGINFSTRSDDYITICFAWPDKNVTTDTVCPSVGKFGVGPIDVKPITAGEWQADFKLPPGLYSGWHDVSLHVGGSHESNPVRIAVDMPAESTALNVTGIADGATWHPDELDFAKGATIAMWIEGLPDNCDRNNLSVFLNGRHGVVEYIDPLPGKASRQVNVRVPYGLDMGPTDLTVAIGNVTSSSHPINLRGHPPLHRCDAPVN
jgi:hypothetical protein